MKPDLPTHSHIPGSFPMAAAPRMLSSFCKHQMQKLKIITLWSRMALLKSSLISLSPWDGLAFHESAAAVGWLGWDGLLTVLMWDNIWRGAWCGHWLYGAVTRGVLHTPLRTRLEEPWLSATQPRLVRGLCPPQYTWSQKPSNLPPPPFRPLCN